MLGKPSASVIKVTYGLNYDRGTSKKQRRTPEFCTEDTPQDIIAGQERSRVARTSPLYICGQKNRSERNGLCG